MPVAINLALLSDRSLAVRIGGWPGYLPGCLHAALAVTCPVWLKAGRTLEDPGRRPSLLVVRENADVVDKDVARVAGRRVVRTRDGSRWECL